MSDSYDRNLIRAWLDGKLEGESNDGDIMQALLACAFDLGAKVIPEPCAKLYSDPGVDQSWARHDGALRILLEVSSIKVPGTTNPLYTREYMLPQVFSAKDLPQAIERHTADMGKRVANMVAQAVKDPAKFQKMLDETQIERAS